MSSYHNVRLYRCGSSLIHFAMHFHSSERLLTVKRIRGILRQTKSGASYPLGFIVYCDYGTGDATWQDVEPSWQHYVQETDRSSGRLRSCSQICLHGISLAVPTMHNSAKVVGNIKQYINIIWYGRCIRASSRAFHGTLPSETTIAELHLQQRIARPESLWALSTVLHIRSNRRRCNGLRIVVLNAATWSADPELLPGIHMANMTSQTSTSRAAQVRLAQSAR
jgi:hypothetical protein